MKRRSPFSLLIAAALVFSFGCETDDIEPTIIVSLNSDQPTIFEAAGTATVTASLNAEAQADVNVNLLFSGSAQEGNDYSLSVSSLSIPQGATSASLTVAALQDNDQEGDESINISIASASGAEVSESNNSVSITIEDDDVAATAQFILNEICYDPSNNALDGDANGDGIYSQDDDSFVELYNPSSRDFDLVGFSIWDSTLADSSTTNFYTFPPNSIIEAGKAYVVFGGGNPTGNFGGSPVDTAGTEDLNFNNSGEFVLIKRPNGSVYLSFNTDELSNNPNESYTRNPDITGAFEQHGDNTPLLFSPGTKIDGSPF